MRLWHYRLIPVLPKKMLIAQWRECIAIKRQWEKGTLKHRLVNYVMNYRKEYFRDYVKLVVKELKNRQININLDLYDEIWDFCTIFSEPISDFYYPEHNDRYLKQCFYNLQEKYDRGIISEEEFEPIWHECNEIVKELM